MTSRRRRSRQRRRRTTGARGGLIAVAVVLGALAAPASSVAYTAKILTPKDDAHIRHDRVRVKVRVRGPNFRAFLDGRNVTKRFHRKHAVRTAVLRRGRKFRLRDHELTIRVGPRYRALTDTVGFIAMKRDDRVMDVRYATDPERRGSHLLSVHTRKRLWNTGRMPRVLLNGHRVEDQLSLDDDDHGIAGGLGAEAGLHFGRNRLVVEMLQRNGRFARDVREFFVPRDRPLAGAGPNVTTGVGDPVVLDGSWTKRPPALTGRPVAYHWRLVSAPRRSHARLRNPNGVRARLKPKAPGTYVARLTVRQVGGGPAGVDDVTIQAPQTASPMGVPIQTITDRGAVAIGTKAYSSSRDGVLMVVLSATGLTPVSGPWGPGVQTFSPASNGHWSNGQKHGCRDLADCVRDVDDKNIVVLSGQGRPISHRGLSGSQAGNLQEAIHDIGGTVSGGGQTRNGASDLVRGDWSVIGNRILVVGQANQNYFLDQAPVDPKLVLGFRGFPADAGAHGSLNGFMQNINENAFQYISPEYQSVDTKWTKSPDEAPSPTRNTILVGDTKYESDSIPNGAIGFQVLVMSQSAPLRELDRKTFVVENQNCTTNQAGVKALNGDLSNWVNTRGGPTAAGSYLMIVQDFGHQNKECWPARDSQQWVHDDLPSGVCSGGGDSCHYLTPFGWNGQGYPNSTSDLFSSWNRLVSGGTVAGNLGKLAGIPFHDVVADYRRPYYDDETHQVVNRDFGGLTVVASTHAYQWSSAFHQGQGDDASITRAKFPQYANGRITGLLRRNEQSQWQLGANALGAGWKSGQDSNGDTAGGDIDQKAFFDLTFQPPTAWPCTVRNPAPCPNVPSEIRAAHRWFVRQLSPKSGATTIRDLYPQSFPATTFDVSAIQRPYPNPGRGSGYFSPQVFEAMKYGSGSWPGLVGEVGDVNQVVVGTRAWESFFRSVADQNAVVNVHAVAQRVITNLRQVYGKLEQQKAEADAGGIVSDLMLFASELADVAATASGQEELVPLLAPAMGAMSAAIELGNNTANTLTGDGASSGQGNVPDAADAIEDQTGQLSYDMNKRYQAIAASLGHFGAIFVDDWGKLQEAAADFDPGGPWALTKPTVNSLGQSIAGEAQTTMYESALPLTYNQWMISPRKTNRNPDGPGELPAATGYHCENPVFNDRPWQNTSTWGLESLGWSGGGSSHDFNSANSANFTIRGLKSVADDLETSVYQYYDESRFRNVWEPAIGDHAGTSAAELLIKPLFDTVSTGGDPSDPGPLGVAKEEIFGLPNWHIRLFQCGSPPLAVGNGNVVDK